MADLNLDAIRERAAGATEGPWFAWDRGVGWYIGVGDPANPASWDMWNRPARCLPEGERTDVGSEADAQFIAHARTDVPALIEEVERLRAGNANLIKNAEILADELIHANVDRTNLQAERDRLRALLDAQIKETQEVAGELAEARTELQDADRAAGGERS